VRPVYFDSSVFLSIFMNDPTASKIKELLLELKRDKIRIYTSIIAVQEVSVLSYRKGSMAQDNYSKIDRLARIEGVTKDIALTAAKFEAQILDQTPMKDREDNKRRKWDCFHIATALALGCNVLYSCDEKQLKRKSQFKVSGLSFLHPRPSTPSLFSISSSSNPAQSIQ
jgi:predicted nucleic acid-binding protein